MRQQALAHILLMYNCTGEKKDGHCGKKREGGRVNMLVPIVFKYTCFTYIICSDMQKNGGWRGGGVGIVDGR